MNFDWKNPLLKITDKIELWIGEMFGMLPNLVVAILTLIIFYFLAKLSSKPSSKLLGKAIHNEALVGLFCRSMHIFVMGLGVFTALDIMNLDKTVTSLLAGVGVIGLALSFAFQDIAANFVSGVIIAIRRPFREGDIVEIAGVMGTLIGSNMRVSIIQTFQGQEVYVPNKNVLQGNIINYSVNRERRIDLPVGISYGEDLNQVKEATIQAVQQVDGVLKQRDIIFDFYEFGSSSINFKVRFWIRYPGEPSIFDITSNVIVAIKQRFDREGITIPFPIRTLDFGIKGGEKLSAMELSLSNHKD